MMINSVLVTEIHLLSRVSWCNAIQNVESIFSWFQKRNMENVIVWSVFWKSAFVIIVAGVQMLRIFSQSLQIHGSVLDFQHVRQKKQGQITYVHLI